MALTFAQRWKVTITKIFVPSIIITDKGRTITVICTLWKKSRANIYLEKDEKTTLNDVGVVVTIKSTVLDHIPIKQIKTIFTQRKGPNKTLSLKTHTESESAENSKQHVKCSSTPYVQQSRQLYSIQIRICSNKIYFKY